MLSIVVPYYNNQETLSETLESVSNQTYAEIELILIDDGSTDDSFSVVEAFIKNNHKLKITSLKQHNQGPSVARNYGASMAVGEYLMFLDADDIIHETYAQKCIDVFETSFETSLVYTKAKLIGKFNQDWNLPKYNLSNFLENNCIYISAIMKKKDFEKAGGFDKNLKYLEDWDLWLSIISSKKRSEEEVVCLPETLFYYRKHSDKVSLTDNQIALNNENINKFYIYKKHYDFYLSNKLDFVSLYDFKRKYEKINFKYYNIWYKKLFYFIKRTIRPIKNE